MNMNKPCPECGSKDVEVFNIIFIHDFGQDVIRPAEFCDAICHKCDCVYPFTRLYDSMEEYKLLNGEE